MKGDKYSVELNFFANVVAEVCTPLISCSVSPSVVCAHLVRTWPAANALGVTALLLALTIQESRHQNMGRNYFLNLKKTEEGPFWPRLLKEAGKVRARARGESHPSFLTSGT